MTRVFHRLPAQAPPLAVRGEGMYLIDAAGRRYLDASGGAAVSCLGHSHPAVVAAVRAQLERLDFAHTSFFSSEPAEALADLLIEAAPSGLERVLFVSGGSEAVEAALKLARQYFVEIGQPQRRHFVARRFSYHGNTLGALAVGHNPWRRRSFDPLLIDTHHIAPCYPYRGCAADETEADYGRRVADELQATVEELGPETVIAFVAETVAGATLGTVPPAPGYFARVREICDRHGILLILDEVMCGMGRTGWRFACEAEGIAPDLVTVAKGLGGGHQPIGATLVSGAVHDAVRDGSGVLQHGHTYMGHAVACAAALAVQRVVAEQDLVARVADLGRQLGTRLAERFGEHPHVGQVRGRGLFQSVELVAERDAKEPYPAATKMHARVKAEALARGLCCYPMGGCVDGLRGDHVTLAPPFLCSEMQIDAMVDLLGQAIDAATGA